MFTGPAPMSGGEEEGGEELVRSLYIGLPRPEIIAGGEARRVVLGTLSVPQPAGNVRLIPPSRVGPLNVAVQPEEVGQPLQCELTACLGCGRRGVALPAGEVVCELVSSQPLILRAQPPGPVARNCPPPADDKRNALEARLALLS